MSMVSCARSTRVVAGFTFAALLLLTGCGSDKSTTAPATTTKAAPSATSSASASADKKSAAVTVDVDDMKFSPADVTIKVGDTVTWKFSDKVPHTVQGIGDRAMGINSPIFDKGEWSYTFTAPGNYRYLCSLHPQMRGSVTVE
ncbi:cupredoxin domain-containing protein [Nocardia australiensis]|uniref:cupredoxin domain-containing protein n=1 Tax=Nocardia australiensis TaxID=2887191 RepID=UPI001D13D99F|nr:cupredoxin family copper-binding protein [Nocardia australiensis]